MHNAAVVAVRYQLTESEFIAAQRTLIGHRVRRRFALLALALALPVGGLYLYGRWLSALLFLVLFPLALAALWPLLSLTWRRMYRKVPAEHREQRVEFSPEGLAFESAMAEGRVRWGAYSHYVETDRLFLLHHQPSRVIVPLPKRAFTPDELARFRELLVAHVPRDRPSSRPRPSVA